MGSHWSGRNLAFLFPCISSSLVSRQQTLTLGTSTRRQPLQLALPGDSGKETSDAQYEWGTLFSLFRFFSIFSIFSALRQPCPGLWNSRKLQAAETHGRSHSNRVGVALQEVSSCWLLFLTALLPLSSRCRCLCGKLAPGQDRANTALSCSFLMNP